MKISRFFSSRHPIDEIEWKTVSTVRKGKNGEILFHMPEVEVPAWWSQTAADILARNYFRKAGVTPYGEMQFVPEEGCPQWLCPSKPMRQDELPRTGETSAKQVFYRLAGHWTYWAWKCGLLKEEADLKAFYDEIYVMLAYQIAAPNSPQWFNTGLWWAYGIEGPDSGQWTVDWEYPVADGQFAPAVDRVFNSYERPQPHACFIQTIKDDLVNPGGIMDLWVREARLFKHGSGTGSNFSSVRGKKESLSGGGVSSGLLSFLKIGDRSAGSIQSGGTTRRAAKMVVVDADHPDIEEFIFWKTHEEDKVASLAVGSRLIKDKLTKIASASELYRGLLVKDALSFGIPQALIDRAIRYPHLIEKFQVHPIEFEGEAYNTISGQNANNTVRLTDDFMERISQGDNVRTWDLYGRVDKQITKTLKAKDLWGDLCTSAWICADPGVQFHDTINRMHTCKADGEITASNPCSEYMFLNDTACNLASLNLVQLRTESGEIDIPAFRYATRLWTIILDLSVQMASFPSEAIAWGTYKYRTLGLGYANLGGLLMRSAIPYDSDQGRALAGAITSLMTAEAYDTSGDLAEELGAFPQYESNKNYMYEVLRQHQQSNSLIRTMGVAGKLVVEAERVWKRALQHHLRKGYRNAQTTLLAPTGTISFVMDCDTTGLEPEFALKKYKNLAGGGLFEMTCEAMLEGLKRQNYTYGQIDEVDKAVKADGTLPPFVQAEHVRVYDCALSRDADSGRFIRPMAHVEMVAAVQPFLSGAASKTINMPESSTIEDVSEVYMQAWKLGVKAVALYRNNCKFEQPMHAAEQKPSPEALADAVTMGVISFNEARDILHLPEVTEGTKTDGTVSATEDPLKRGQRKPLPSKRRGYTQKIKIGGRSIYERTGEYEDGTLGEIFLDFGKDGSVVQGLLGSLAKAISIGLQYGVPLEEFVEAFVHTKFEPAGFVEGHDRLKMCESIPDAVVRDLGLTYLGMEELVQIQQPKPGVAARVRENQDPANAETDPSFIPNLERQAMYQSSVKVVARKVDGVCWVCHNPTLIQTGPCMTCSSCGYSSGCG